ncbi:MAG: FMN-binding negative transcriptional regulator [Alphaproteobacteria bacterium]|nr:FMN-binding negative transcriptional regulator [Alphaproteobacteria bacterium]
MFVPRPFAEEDRATLHRLIRDNNFGLLISVVDGAPFGSHLPFMLDDDRGPHGTLLVHMARANPQWKSFDGGSQVLAVFQGPHAYISPGWYDPANKAVPTWNYAVVHAYGVPHIMEDSDETRAHQERLVNLHEAGMANPWRMDSQPEDYLAAMLKGIVACEIPIDRLEGKFKLNQNHPEGNRRGAIAGLRAHGGAGERAIAELMAAREDGD